MDLFDSRFFLPAVDYPHDFGLCLMVIISACLLLVCWFKSGVTPTYGVVSWYVLYPSFSKLYLLMFQPTSHHVAFLTLLHTSYLEHHLLMFQPTFRHVTFLNSFIQPSGLLKPCCCILYYIYVRRHYCTVTFVTSDSKHSCHAHTRGFQPSLSLAV